MKYTECKDCILNSHRGFHFEMDGVTTCDQYGNCMFLSQKNEQEGDLISREALINAKPEFMNEKVVRDTKYQTTKDRIYAKAWNACNSYWLNTIKNASALQEDHIIPEHYIDPDEFEYYEDEDVKKILERQKEVENENSI